MLQTIQLEWKTYVQTRTKNLVSSRLVLCFMGCVVLASMIGGVFFRRKSWFVVCQAIVTLISFVAVHDTSRFTLLPYVSIALFTFASIMMLRAVF